jgi:hypothetical protein
MKQRIYTIILLLILDVSNLNAKVLATSFFQDIKTEMQLPPEAGKNVIKLFSSNQNVIAVTSNGVFRYKNGIWIGKSNGSNWISAAVDKQEKIWLSAANFIQDEAGKQKIALPESAGKDTILCLFWENNKTLHVGTTKGFLTWKGKWNIHPGINGRVNDIETDAQNNLWVATTDGLWRRSEGKWVNLDETLMAVGNEMTYFSLSTQNEGKDVLFSSPWSVGCIAEDGNHWVVRGADGLPYGPVTVIRKAENGLWFGTEKGAIKKDSGWHYYNGRRWLPDSKVNDILPIDSRTVWIATPNGISQIQQVEMTLEQKARIFEENIEKRHNRLGLINHAYLKIPGDLTTSYTENEDNDGLWTACFLAAECFRYGITKRDDAKIKAVHTFEALERLETVTGIPGYPARSYALATDSIKQSRSPHPKHWHPSPDGKWQWLDDTSSDEIVGHIFTIALFHDLVADEIYKKRSVNLIERILDNIIDNNFVLIDFDGKPTRWGIWNPDSLNHSKNWMYERGLNSLQILSHLKTGVQLTGNPKFEKAYNELVVKHGYAKNAVQAKQYGPFETSHSDDILNFFPYYNLFKYAKNDPYFLYYQQSLERSWKAVESDRMPVWNIIASALLKKDCGLKTALEELQQFPIDQVNWTMDNTHRRGLERDQMAGRGGNPQAVHPVPTPESGVSRWNTNPKSYVSGNGGKTEETGTYFLFAYWMGRYYGLIKD